MKKRVYGVGLLCIGLIIWGGSISLKKFEDLSTLLLDRDQIILSCDQSRDEKWRFLTTPDDVSDLYLKILINFEDKRFYYHFGVDPIALARSTFQFLKNGRILSGGSTLTMQVVRLLHPRKRTIISKCIEIIEATLLECRYSKKEILTMYLTLMPQGNNFEGIFSASYAYFKKKPKDLNYAEMALLVAIPQSPTKLRPNIYPERAKGARNKVLDRSLGILSKQDINEAKEMVLEPTKNRFPTNAQHLLQRLKQKPIIHSTLDGKLQEGVSSILHTTFKFQDDEKSLAILIVDNRTRKVICYIGSYNYFDRPRQGFVDLIKAVRSPGSALKPFIYAKAFDLKLIDANTIVKDTKRHFFDYSPSNFKDIFHGETTIKESLQQSLNTPAVLLLEKIGPQCFLNSLEELSIHLKLPKESAIGLPIALGGVGLTLEELTSLYVALAQNGDYQKLIYEENTPVKINQKLRICTKESALKIKKILQGAPPPDGYISHTVTNASAIAFKTGTSYGGRDALCVGYTKDYTVAVWIGRADGTAIASNIGRFSAAPIVFSIFYSLLPKCMDDDSADESSPMLAKHRQKIGGNRDEKLKIIYPLDGIKILKTTKEISLKTEENKGTITWIINNVPIASNKWIPNSPGFYTITALDENGNSAITHVRVIDDKILKGGKL